jgi:hypothetical protein
MWCNITEKLFRDKEFLDPRREFRPPMLPKVEPPKVGDFKALPVTSSSAAGFRQSAYRSAD